MFPVIWYCVYEMYANYMPTLMFETFGNPFLTQGREAVHYCSLETELSPLFTFMKPAPEG